MKLKDIASKLDPTKLVRVEVEDPDASEQHIFVNIEFAMRDLSEIEVKSYEEMPWTYVVYALPFKKDE